MANSTDFLYIWEVTEEFTDPKRNESNDILHIAQFAFEVDAKEYVDMMNAKYHPKADRYIDPDPQKYVYRRIVGKR